MLFSRKIEKGAEPPAGATIYRVPEMKMKNSELQDYLSTFPDDADVSYLLANPRKRKLYECVNVFGVMDAPNPIFCIDVGEAKDMDAEMVAACEEDERDAENIEGQMDITDFPEVLP